MAYFNHAFQKTIVGTKGVVTSGKVWELKNGDAGKVGFFGAAGAHKDTAITTSQEPFYVAGSTFRPNDMIGKFAGGYQEANKSKVINPKFINKIYRVNHSLPAPAVLEVGSTSASNECSKDFFCGETYYLRVDVKGGAVMSTLRHNAYSTVPAMVSCCGSADPTVNVKLGNGGVEIYYAWAKAISENTIFDGFILPVLAAEESSDVYTYYVPTEADKEILVNSGKYDIDVDDVKTFADFEEAFAAVSPAYAATAAGLVLVGAYEETKFGNCTFQVTDGYNLEPLRIYASETDSEGDACFNGICINPKWGATGQQGQGYGESVIRRVILDESYHQRFFNTDLRKREIEGATGVFSVIDRNAMYDSLYILHSVPRFNNPTGVFDNDQYLVEIVGTDDVIDTLASNITSITGIAVEVYGEDADNGKVVKVTPASTTIAPGASKVITVKFDPTDSEVVPTITCAESGITGTVDASDNNKVTIAVAGTVSAGTYTVNIKGSGSDTGKDVTVTVS